MTLLNVRLTDTSHRDTPSVILSAHRVATGKDGTSLYGVHVVAPAEGHSVPSCAALLEQASRLSFLVVSHDWQLTIAPMPSDSADIEAARELGRKAGRCAGSWAADGNTSVEHARKVLAMMEAGDPAAEQFLPCPPNLSGEYADDPTPLSVAREVTGDDDPSGDVVDALAEAWEEGAMETFEDTCVTELRTRLPDEG